MIAFESLIASMELQERWVLHLSQLTQKHQSQIQALLEVPDVVDLLLSVLALLLMLMPPGRWILEPEL